MLPLVFGHQGDDAVLGEVQSFGGVEEQGQQTRQMREVARDENIARLCAKAVPEPDWGVVGLQVARGRQLRQGVTGAPKRLGCLTGAELAAVPDDRGVRAVFGGFRRGKIDRRPADRREWTARIDVRPDGVTMVDEVQMQDVAS